MKFYPEPHCLSKPVKTCKTILSRKVLFDQYILDCDGIGLYSRELWRLLLLLLLIIVILITNYAGSAGIFTGYPFDTVKVDTCQYPASSYA